MATRADLWVYNAENRLVGFSYISSHLVERAREKKSSWANLVGSDKRITKLMKQSQFYTIKIIEPIFYIYIWKNVVLFHILSLYQLAIFFTSLHFLFDSDIFHKYIKEVNQNVCLGKIGKLEKLCSCSTSAG